jgi:hypothetical protein
MDNRDDVVQRGDILQIDPEWTGNMAFAGCFLVVEEVRGWGVIGVVDVFDKAKGAKGLYDTHGAHYWFAIYERPDDGLARHFEDYDNVVLLRVAIGDLKAAGHAIEWRRSTAPWFEQFGEGWMEL